MLLPTFIKGHVTISDAMTGEILIDKDNQIHYENMSEALATAIAKQDGGYIYSVVSTLVPPLPNAIEYI